MAELPDVGRRCELKSCNRLDFLPFVCPLCKCCFCSDHRFTHGCDSSKQRNHGSHVTSSKPVRVFMCSLNGCSEMENIRISCTHCEKNYCLKHRYAEEHSCDTFRKSSKHYQVSDSTTASSSVFQKPAETKVKRLNEIERKKMDRILVMKLKINATITAEIPTEERIFLFIEGDDTRKRQAVVVSQKWTIGRCASSVKKLLFPDESKSLQIFRNQPEESLDYAEVVSKYLHDLDTINVRLV